MEVCDPWIWVFGQDEPQQCRPGEPTALQQLQTNLFHSFPSAAAFQRLPRASQRVRKVGKAL